MDISGSALENPTAHGLARLLVVPSGAFAPHIAGHPGPETEQLQQVVAGADEHLLGDVLRQHRRLSHLPLRDVVADAKYGTMPTICICTGPT